jgi:tetratricopeptide (TPR) repeat protein
MFGRKGEYDRTRLLTDAARALRKGKLQKAVRRYREILGVEPGNADIHRRLAPVLARMGQRDAAWTSYRRAAEALEERGFVERAVGVYRDAACRLPRLGDVWLAIAELELERGRRPDAVAALRDGRRKLSARSERVEAIRLLERARELAPGDFEASFDLAALLGKVGRRERALELLDDLAEGCDATALRRVRARQLNLAPGVRNLWRWLRSLGA